MAAADTGKGQPRAARRCDQCGRGTTAIAGSLSAVTAPAARLAGSPVTAQEISVAATAKLAAVGVGAITAPVSRSNRPTTTTVAAGASFAANAVERATAA